jgi:dTDP-4-dehydrorhamnose reductase
MLVTGTTGQVGSALRSRLASLGEVISVDRNVIDLSLPDLIAPALDMIGPELIINPAAYTAVDEAECEKDLAFRVNAYAPGAMASWAARHDVPIIHFSTDYVFDGSGDHRWREEDETNPLSIYGASKLAGERAVRESGCDQLIIRTCWVYSAGGRNFLTTITRLARNLSEVTVVADQIGAPTSAVVIAETLAAILGDRLSVQVRKRFRMVDGLLHLCASGETSWYEFTLAIVDGLRRNGEPLAVRQIVPIQTKDYPTKAVRPRNSRLDLSRLRNAFGIEMPDWRTSAEREIGRLLAIKEMP